MSPVSGNAWDATARRRTRLVILLILILAVALRLFGLGLSLPILGIRSDEEKVVQPALCFFTGDYNPRFFAYPTLHLYLTHLVLAPFYLWGLATGRWEGAWDALRVFNGDPTLFVLVARFLSVGFGLGIVALTFHVGRRVGGRLTGILAMSFAAVAHGLVREAHFATLDTAQTFWMLASLSAALRLESTASPRAVLWAAVLGGAAASTKYTGALIVPVVLVAVVRWARAERRSVLGWTLTSGATSVAAFLLFSPFIVLDAPLFSKSFAMLFQHHAEAPGASSPSLSGWSRMADYTVFGLGAPIALLGTLGLLDLIRRRALAGRLLALTALLYFPLVGLGHILFFRYVLPMAPLLVIGCAHAILVSARWLPARARPIWMSVLTAVAIVPTLNDSLAFDRLAASTDTRLSLVEWIRQEVPPGSTIVTNCPLGTIGSLSRTRDVLEKSIRQLRAYETPYLQFRAGLAETLLERFPAFPPEPRYRVVELAPQMRTLEPARVEIDQPVYVVIASKTPWVDVPPRLLENVIRKGELVFQADPRLEGRDPPFYDPQEPGFYFPLAGLSSLERSGPNLRVFRIQNRR